MLIIKCTISVVVPPVLGGIDMRLNGIVSAMLNLDCFTWNSFDLMGLTQLNSLRNTIIHMT